MYSSPVSNVGNSRMLALQSANSSAFYSQPSNSWDQQAIAGANYLVNGAANLTQEQIQYLQKQIEHERKHLSLWGFFKRHVLNGIIERGLVSWMAVEIAKELLHIRGTVGIMAAMALGVLGGEAMVQLEHGLENKVEKAINGEVDESDNNPWDLAKMIAKTISISLLSGLGIAKKMFFFFQLSKQHNPKEQSDSAIMTKNGQIESVKFFGRLFGQDTKDIEHKLKNDNLNILDSFALTGEWFEKGIATKKNKFSAAVGKAMSGFFTNFMGCPSMREGLTSGLNRGMIMKDASVKLSIAIPTLLAATLLTNLVKQLINKHVPEENDYVLESFMKQQGLTVNA